VSGRRLFGVGVVGAIVAAVCCTPLLAIVLGAIGFSAWPAWSDYVVIPALLVFLAIAVYGFTRWRGAEHCCETRHA
jgi:mercuric ion transport protein